MVTVTNSTEERILSSMRAQGASEGGVDFDSLQSRVQSLSIGGETLLATCYPHSCVH